jgi:hypothetical protein
MFSVEQVRSETRIQEIVINEWTDCKNFQPNWEGFSLYNGNKEVIGFAAVERADLTVVIRSFAMEPLSNQPVMRDFFFKGILGAMATRGAFFLQAAENCAFLMKEFQFEAKAEIESLLKGSCHHEA